MQNLSVHSPVLARRITELALVGRGEVAQILETDTEIDIDWALVFLLDKPSGFLQAAADNPAHRCGAENLLKLLLERRQRPPSVVCKTLQIEVHHIMRFHKLLQVDLPRPGKVEKNRFQRRVYLYQGENHFLNLRLHQLLGRVIPDFEIMLQRLEKPLKQGMLGQHHIRRSGTVTWLVVDFQGIFVHRLFQHRHFQLQEKPFERRAIR